MENEQETGKRAASSERANLCPRAASHGLDFFCVHQISSEEMRGAVSVLLLPPRRCMLTALIVIRSEPNRIDADAQSKQVLITAATQRTTTVLTPLVRRHVRRRYFAHSSSKDLRCLRRNDEIARKPSQVARIVASLICYTHVNGASRSTRILFGSWSDTKLHHASQPNSLTFVSQIDSK